MALARGGSDQLVEQAAGQRFVFFALRGRVVLFGKDVGGALVFADCGEVGLNPNLVEQPAREQLLQPHAHQVDLALRHHRNLAGRGRDQVGQIARSEVARAFEVRGGPLLMGCEVVDEPAQFLGLRELHLRVGYTDRQANDSRILSRLAQCATSHVERGLVVVDQSAQAIGAAFDYRALELKLDHRARRNAMRPPLHDVAADADHDQDEDRPQQPSQLRLIIPCLLILRRAPVRPRRRRGLLKTGESNPDDSQPQPAAGTSRQASALAARAA